MKQTLDMRFIRYLNLFERVMGIRSKNCFFYNNYVIFAVPRSLVSKAIGEKGKNVKKLIPMLGKKIKIVALPKSIEDTERFISEIVDPVQFKNLEVTQKEIIITAGKQSKAALIGRNKVRFNELKKIVEEFFGKDLKII